MKKTERKSILPKLVVILLMVMLVSTSLLSRTLAKYVSTGTLLTDTARVAKWGVVITPTQGGLFATQYATDETPGYTGSHTVASVDTTFVVAPGTSGTITSFSITGSPEVASRLTITDNGSAINGWTLADNSVYEPVRWTVTVGGGTSQSNLDFAGLQSALSAVSLDLAPNTDLSTSGLGLAITWEWPFSGNDVNDTYLGDKATAPTISLNFNVTLTQID